jgi:hypothetical protein
MPGIQGITLAALLEAHAVTRLLLTDLDEGDTMKHEDDEWLDAVDEDGDTLTDVEADADTLADAGWGTDEDYGLYEGGEDY